MCYFQYSMTKNKKDKSGAGERNGDRKRIERHREKKKGREKRREERVEEDVITFMNVK